MDCLLDTAQQRKITILDHIYAAQHHTLTFNDLQKFNQISAITLVKFMDAIQNDLQSIGRAGCLIEERIGNQKLYTISKKDAFIRDELKNMYLQTSAKFRILIAVFENEQHTINSLSKQIFISPSSLRREIESLNTLLSQFLISLDIHRKIKIIGSEKLIRLFYSHLFFDGYQGRTWPFSQVHQSFFDDFSAVLPTTLYSSIDVKNHIYIVYAMGVSATRCLQNFRIEPNTHSVPYFEDNTSEDFTAKFKYLENYLQKYVDQSVSLEELHDEVLFLYSIIFSHKNYYDKSSIIPMFFFSNPLLNQLHFMDDALYIVNEIFTIFDIHPSADEHYKLLYNVCIITYRSYLFGIGLSYMPIHWSLDKVTVTEKNVYYKLALKVLKKHLNLDKTHINRQFHPYLLKSYSIAVTNIVKYQFMRKPVNVLFIVNETDYNFLYGSLTSSFAIGYLNIQAVGLDHPSIDVVISDTLLSHELLSLDVSVPIIHFEAASYLEYLGQIVEDLLSIQFTKNQIEVN